MTLYEVIDNLKNIAIAKNNINYVGDGDIYKLNSTPDIAYSVFFITENTHNIDIDTNTYSLNLFYVDRLTADKDNELKIKSDGITILKDIINEFNSLYPDVSITFPIQVTTFLQRFADECAGAFAVLQIETDNEIGECYE